MNTQSILNQVKAIVDQGGYKTYDWRSYTDRKYPLHWQIDGELLELTMTFQCPCGRPDARFVHMQYFPVEMPEDYIVDAISHQIMDHFQAHIDGEQD